jgi:sulfite oxidase
MSMLLNASRAMRGVLTRSVANGTALRVAALGIGTGAIAATTMSTPAECFSRKRKANTGVDKSYLERMPKGHEPRSDLPFFSIDQVKDHTTAEKGYWVTFKGGVYDITEFMYGHPGGKARLEMASGTDLAIYWDVYRMHYRHHVTDFIERFRVGNLSPEDAVTMETAFEFDNPYENDPERHPMLMKTIRYPFCGEAPLGLLGKDFYTPNELHYVRLHLPVPQIEPEEWKVTIMGNGIREKTFDLRTLQKTFKHHELACTLQCAGNRREEFNMEDGKRVFISPNWRVAAFSNAKYKGVYLRDVLEHCGLDVNAHALAEFPLNPKQRHVQFECTDMDECGAMEYGVSIPIEKAVDPRGDVMLVWEMNGKPLPADHGAPVRMLCPGCVGNKSAKFIERIIVAEDQSLKDWHLKSYRNFAPDVSFEDDLSRWHKLSHDVVGDKTSDACVNSKGPICYLMPVQSIITEPQGQNVIGGKDRDTVKIQGVAWSGNGIGVARVDVSLDGGKNFTAADLLEKPADVKKREQGPWGRKWSWVQFEKEFKLTPEQKDVLAKGNELKLDFVSKALDNQWNVQPETPGPFYNPRGVVINNWYHVPVTLKGCWDKNRMERVEGDDSLNPPSGGRFFAPYEEHGWDAEMAHWHSDMTGKPRTDYSEMQDLGRNARRPDFKPYPHYNKFPNQMPADAHKPN